MEQLEDRLALQIKSVQEQSDQMREAGFARYENKLMTIETTQPTLDKKMAEYAGTVRGLSDEMQCQVRRIDQTDARLWEWRHQLEEELRSKLTQIETNSEQVASNFRIAKATSDEAMSQFNKRLLKVEAVIDERSADVEGTKGNILMLDSRLKEVEDAECERARTTAVALYSGEVGGGGGGGSTTRSGLSPTYNAGFDSQDKLTVAALEAQVADTTRKMEQLQGDAHELLTRMESQEERYKSLRTLSDTKDDQIKNLGERFERENLDFRFKEFQTRFQEMEKNRVQQQEQLELLQQKLEGSVQAHEEMGNSMRRLQERQVQENLALMAGNELEMAGAPYGSVNIFNMEDCQARVQECEDRVAAFSRELEILRSDTDMGTSA